jgi:hypothetical protein
MAGNPPVFEANPKPRPTADHALPSMTGSIASGSVMGRNGKFLTYDVDDLHVGVFATLREAFRARRCAGPGDNRRHTGAARRLKTGN